jgi:hypothetical protein
MFDGEKESAFQNRIVSLASASLIRRQMFYQDNRVLVMGEKV